MITQHITTSTSTNTVRTIAITAANVGVQYHDTDNLASTIVIEVNINVFSNEVQKF